MEETNVRDTEWSRLKMVVVWISVDLVEIERSGQCRVYMEVEPRGLLMSWKVARGRNVSNQALTLSHGQLAKTQLLEASPNGKVSQQ